MNSLGHGPNSLPAKVLGFAILIVALVIVPTVVVLAANADQLPWPQFRGPDATGIGDGKPPVEFAPNKNVVWKTPIESGLSSPVIARGRVFLTEFDRTTIQLSTLCIDQKTGRILFGDRVKQRSGELVVRHVGGQRGQEPLGDRLAVAVIHHTFIVA